MSPTPSSTPSMLPDTNVILHRLTKEISSQRKVTFTQTGKLGVPLEYDSMSTYLPLNLPNVFGGRKKYVYAYPARIITGAPEVAREHAGLALCNAVASAEHREEAISRILSALIDRVLEGPLQDSTTLAEVLEETYEQLSNRMFVGRAGGDLENLEKVPNQFRRLVASLTSEALLSEWNMTEVPFTTIDRLLGISSFYGFLRSRSLIYPHEFLLTLDVILKEHTPNSLEALMVVVIYLMSRCSMTEAPCAIPLEYWNVVLRQLDVLEEVVKSAIEGRPIGTTLGNSLGLVETDPTPTSISPESSDSYLSAITTLRDFVDEFVSADSHASIFRHQYACGYVPFYADPPLMYSQGTPMAHAMKRQYLTALCDIVKYWAILDGLEEGISWDLLRDVEYKEWDLDADGNDPLGEGQYYSFSEEAKMRNRVPGRKPQAKLDGADPVEDNERTPTGPKDAGNVDQNHITAPVTVHQSQGHEDLKETPESNKPSHPTPIWMRRGINNPRFQWTPRRAGSTLPYDEAYYPKAPANAKSAEMEIDRVEKILQEVDVAGSQLAPFSLQSLRCQPATFQTGAHHILLPIDPRISTPKPEFARAMKKCDLVWRYGPNGFYRAELVGRAGESTVISCRSGQLRRGDSIISPCYSVPK